MKATQRVVHIVPRTRDLGEELYLAQIDAARAQRAAAMMQVPANPVAELREAFYVSKSNYHVLRGRGLGPPTFRIGRTAYCLTRDWVRWLEEMSTSAEPDDSQSDDDDDEKRQA